MIEVRNYIDGSWASTEAHIEDIEPALGKPLAQIPRSTAKDVTLAVDAAVRAAPSWAAQPIPRRSRFLDAIADEIELRAEELAVLESRDTGKPLRTARTVDIPRAVTNFRYFAGAIRHDVSACHPMTGALNYTLRSPIGVAALITPWNLPLYLLSWKVAPALGMGNTVVAKPSEMTPLTANALAEIIHDVGIPPGVFNVVHGLGAEAGAALVEEPRINGISFTGGTATGARVAAAAAPAFKKLSLELGGKNPTIIFADADFEKAVEGAVTAGFSNQGEICLCGSRILVERPIYDRFVEAMATKVNALTVGDPRSDTTDIGALISEAHRDKVTGYIDLAQEEGGTLVAGGKPAVVEGECADGYFVMPTVVTGLPIDCRTATEEIFGPVVTVHPFDNEDEMLAQANGIQYGLSASLWTRDLERAHRVSARLECGMVWVNTWLKRDLRVPFGGVKQSGVGREGGKDSLAFFSESKNVCIALGES